MLELRSVTYRYAGASRPAIEAVDLTVQSGEIVGLVGPNEAGKTTTCLVASGLAPTSIGGELGGAVMFEGRPLAAGGPSGLAGRTAILLSDSPQLTGMAASVVEEIAFGPINLGLPVPETMARARWAMRVLGIDDLAERHPAHVSGGQARLVAIASILAMRPAVLVLDEPLGALDAASRDRLVRVLRDLAGEGTGVLVAEHDTAFLAALGARLVRVHGGRLA